MTDTEKLDYNQIIQRILDDRNSMKVIIKDYYKIHGDLFLSKLGESVSKWHNLPALNNFKKSVIDYCNLLLHDSEIEEQRKIYLNIMDENIRKILEYLQTQIENHVTWTNWDDSLFDKLNIDKSQNPRLLSILKSKNYIDTMEPIGDLKAVSINDNGTTYLVNFDNKKLEPKTIYISGNYNQVSQDSASNFANNTLTQPSTLQSTGKDKRNWIIKILNSNWTITIIGAIIAGIVVAYFIFRLKWNK